jgi:hypothetical protein
MGGGGGAYGYDPFCVYCSLQSLYTVSESYIILALVLDNSVCPRIMLNRLFYTYKCSYDAAGEYYIHQLPVISLSLKKIWLDKLLIIFL